MSDAKQATPPAELERQICSATVPKNEREWWAHHEIARLQESNRLRAELLAAARAELAALRAALAEPDEYTVECNGKKSSVLTAMMNGRAKREAALADADEPVAWLWNGTLFQERPAIPDKMKGKFTNPIPLYTHPPKRERADRAEAERKAPLLAKYQPCGCVICTCEGERCDGCGAKWCGAHPVSETPNPIYEPHPFLARAKKAEAELAEARRERDMARAERDTLLMDVGEFVKWFARHYPEPSQHPDHPWCVINARL